MAAWHPSLDAPPAAGRGCSSSHARAGVGWLCRSSPPTRLCSLATLCAQAGAPLEPPFDLPAIERALELLAELATLAPAEAFDWEPPQALAWLARGDGDYVPLTFGFVSYAADVRFGAPPGGRGAILGGAGLAVTAASPSPAEAEAFAALVRVRRGADGHRGGGGRPARRPRRLDDAAVDAAAHGFYGDTRAAIEHAWVRPRDAWWPPFQRDGGRLAHDGLRARRPVARIAAGDRESRLVLVRDLVGLVVPALGIADARARAPAQPLGLALDALPQTLAAVRTRACSRSERPLSATTSRVRSSDPRLVRQRPQSPARSWAT